jgi:hypothetical protein
MSLYFLYLSKSLRSSVLVIGGKLRSALLYALIASLLGSVLFFFVLLSFVIVLNG